MDSLLIQQKIEQLLTQSSKYDDLLPTDPDYMIYHPSPVGYNTTNEQQYIFQNLILGFAGGSILDLGCGRGDLYGYISEIYGSDSFKYHGIDRNPLLTDIAKKKWNLSNITNGSFEQDTLPSADWVVASGVYTERRTESEDTDLIKLFDNVELMYNTANHVVSFNLLSPIGNKIVPGFFYVHPGLVLDMLIEKYQYVSIRHNYSKDIYTVTIYKYDKI